MKRGFTLIELLVVISIIGLLASIVLVALNGARAKGKDGAVEEEMHQLQVVAEEEYDSSNSYANVQSNGWEPTSGCNFPNQSTDAYASQAEALCNVIVADIGASTIPPTPNITTTGFIFYAGVQMGSPGNFSENSKYSFMAWLPGAQVWMCVGSDGVSTSDTNGQWQSLGCYANP